MIYYLNTYGVWFYTEKECEQYVIDEGYEV